MTERKRNLRPVREVTAPSLPPVVHDRRSSKIQLRKHLVSVSSGVFTCRGMRTTQERSIERQREATTDDPASGPSRAPLIPRLG